MSELFTELPPANRAKFDEMLQSRQLRLLLILGNFSGVEKVVAHAQKVAEQEPVRRRVIWIKDLSVLSETERKQFTGGSSGNVVCSLDHPDGTTGTRPVACHMGADEARRFSRVLRCFASSAS